MTALLLEPCQTEDSTDCWWDATVNGNGQGHSFVNYDGSWQVIEFPQGEHLTGVYVTAIEQDPSSYTADEPYLFDWTTAPNVTTTTTTAPILAETGGPMITPDVGFGIAVIIVVGITFLRHASRRRREGL